MIGVELRFVAGRYHATPWGRNVNEGVPEWPPSPYRLARALLDVAYRRHPQWDHDRLHALLRPLQDPTGFLLPPVTTAHVRAYLRQGSANPADKKKILDAFVAVDPDEPVTMLFEATLEAAVARDLSTLLGELHYLGRSESWVSAQLRETAPQGAPRDRARFLCEPVSAEIGHEHGDPVQVACLRPEQSYAALEAKPPATVRRRTRDSPRALSWLDAVCMSTKALLKAGWSAPPAMWERTFALPAQATRGTSLRPRATHASTFHEARFSLQGSVLPRVTDAIKIAERCRTLLMGIHRKIMDDDPARVSPVFSGKGADGRPARGHQHAYFLPCDHDRDGRIDHLVVRATTAFGASELEALDRLRSLWQSAGRPEIRLVLEALSATPGEQRARRWVSATPFVSGRHYRRGRGSHRGWVDDEIRRACRFHGLPEPSALLPTQTTQAAHPLRWSEFLRSRKGKRPMTGHGRELTFSEPVRGPFAIGALAHFGLGLFMPADG